jgi:hypothetical protein
VATTQWVNLMTGEWLDRAALADLRRRAHRAYEANMHLFEDEREALVALGVATVTELDQLRSVRPTAPAVPAAA